MNFRSVLITGGAGFVGSNLALNLKRDFPGIQVTCLDNLKRRGSELNLPRLKDAGIVFVHGDIRNEEDFAEVPEIDLLIEASAEPSVLAGVNNPPKYVVNTNLNGTINCLDFAVKNKAAFLFLSTSRVYPVAPLEQLDFFETSTRFELSESQNFSGISTRGIGENFPLDGYRSIYGTTKLASELMIREYEKFYGLKNIINRCGVLTGPWQMGKSDQGVVVLWASHHYWQRKLAYIGFGGSGKQVRDVLHIEDLYDLVKIQLQDFDRLSGQVFNAGGGREVSTSLLELTELCARISGNAIEIEKVTENRAADIPLYITDNSKIEKWTGWKPRRNMEMIMTDIHQWIDENNTQLKQILIK